jgi:hypothetical protein
MRAADRRSADWRKLTVVLDEPRATLAATNMRERHYALSAAKGPQTRETKGAAIPSPPTPWSPPLSPQVGGSFFLQTEHAAVSAAGQHSAALSFLLCL